MEGWVLAIGALSVFTFVCFWEISTQNYLLLPDIKEKEIGFWRLVF